MANFQELNLSPLAKKSDFPQLKTEMGKELEHEDFPQLKEEMFVPIITTLSEELPTIEMEKPKGDQFFDIKEIIKEEKPEKKKSTKVIE
jgi:hypothetical protein